MSTLCAPVERATGDVGKVILTKPTHDPRPSRSLHALLTGDVHVTQSLHEYLLALTILFTGV